MNNSKGLTLIEVLIALSIIAIAMTAIIKVANQNIASTDYLERKAIGILLAKEGAHAVRAHLIRLPDPPDAFRETVTTLGKKWLRVIKQENTANSHIKKIIVLISAAQDKNNPIVQIESYIRYDHL